MRKEPVEGHGAGRKHAPGVASLGASLNHFERNSFAGRVWGRPRGVGQVDRLARCKKPHILRQERLPSILRLGSAATRLGRIGQVADPSRGVAGHCRKPQRTNQGTGHGRGVRRVVEREVAS